MLFRSVSQSRYKAGAGQASGVGLSDAKGMQTGIAIQGIGLELANLASQVELNKSQAEKNKAEADKAAGVDTQVQQATMENLIAQTANEKVKKGLIYADTRLKDKADETRWNIKSLQKGIDKLAEEINGMKLDNELKERTIDKDRKSTRLNSSHRSLSRMPSSA